MKYLIALALLFPLHVLAQTDPTHDEFTAAVSVTVRYLEAIRRTQQTETAEILDIQAKLTLLIEQTNKRLDALEAAQKAAPAVRMQSITVAVPATP